MIVEYSKFKEKILRTRDAGMYVQKNAASFISIETQVKYQLFCMHNPLKEAIHNRLIMLVNFSAKPYCNYGLTCSSKWCAYFPIV